MSLAIGLGVSVSVLSMAGPAAFAAKGGGAGSKGNKGGGSVSFSQAANLWDSTDGSHLPRYGDTITFTGLDASSNPTVSVSCSQNGTQVYSASAGYYPSYPWSQSMNLSSASWTGGAASCTASLVSNSGNASFAFSVSA